MKNIDRRQWLRTAGLSGSFLFLGGLNVPAMELTARPLYPDKLIQLNANENPYGPSQKVRETITNTFDKACRYPFRDLSSLVKSIAEKEGVTKDHIVVCGGSTEGLTAAGLIYGRDGGEIIAGDPTFQTMMRYGKGFGAYIHRVPVNDKMELDLDAFAKRITSKTRLIYLCNPNNPTGTIIEKNKLKDFCTTYDDKAVIFSDEAYYDFITEPDYPSMIELVKEGRNIIVSKTFSKVFGMAGLRVGYLIARPDIAKRLKAGVMANTNILAIEAAKEALKDDDFYKFSIAKNKEAKDHIYNTLNDLNLEYVKSHTNFVFFKTNRHIDEMIDLMKKENIQIGRPFPPLYNWARISTGTMEEMELFGNALKKVMG